MAAIAQRRASSCVACLLLLSAAAAASDGSTARKETVAAAAQGGDPPRLEASITVEEDRGGHEVPPPAPSGEERRLIGDHIRGQTREIDACYQRQERKAPRGKLVVRFDIGPNGRVIGATADGIDDRDLVLCVVNVVRSWTFARPRSSAKLRVAYPWIFPPVKAR